MPEHRWYLTLVLAVLLTATCAAAQGLGQAQSSAAKGNQLYEMGSYEEAIAAYQAAIDAGLDSEVLYYNLGNAWFKQGNIGKAILCYRRALLREPRDEAARANLKQAKALLKDEALVPLSFPLFLKPLVWLYSRFSLNEWTGAALLAWLLLGITGATRAWFRPPWLRGKGMLRVLALAFLACAIMAGVHANNELRHHTAIVVEKEVDVRSGPGETYNLSFKIHEGLQVFVDQRRPKWARIHLGGELIGWVPDSSIEEI